MIKIIFLDFTGTIDPVSSKSFGPDEQSILALRRLVDLTGAKIVYSSTRRDLGWEHCAEYIGLPLDHSLGFDYDHGGVTPKIERPRRKGLEGLAKDAKDLFYYKPRQEEILQWFKEWKGDIVGNFVILDDDPITDKSLVSHWIPSISENGFLEAECDVAIKILNGGKKDDDQKSG